MTRTGGRSGPGIDGRGDGGCLPFWEGCKISDPTAAGLGDGERSFGPAGEPATSAAAACNRVLSGPGLLVAALLSREEARRNAGRTGLLAAGRGGSTWTPPRHG